MSELVHDCPRCNSKNVTFDVHAATFTAKYFGWQLQAEIFGVCRRCNKATIIVVREKERDNVSNLERIGGIGGFKGNINDDFIIDGYISLKDKAGVEAPEHLPDDIAQMFDEGARCMAVSCFNAAGTMFRLCLDRATKSKLPAEDVNGLNNKIRRSLGFRMTWLFDNNLLPRGLEDLAMCVKEDGNDGAHEGTLDKADAEDLLDFTVAVLERLYTEPERLRLAAVRRAERRQGAA